MRILALTSAYPQEDDGKDIVTPTVKYFCDEWAALGHEVVVVHNNSCFPRAFYWVPDSIRNKMASKMGFNFPTRASRTQLSYRKNGVQVFRFPMVKAIPHSKFSKRVLSKQITRIEKTLDDIGFVPDVIISHWVNPQIELLIPLGRRYGATTSLVFHGDCSEKNIERFHLIEAVKELDAVGCRNKAYAEYVQKALYLERTPFICYSGIPDELAEECERTLASREFENRPEFIYVGRLVKYKNADTILEALHHVYEDRPFTFHIVGSGAERENLEALVTKYRMQDRVIFHGQLPRDEAFALMQKSTYFIMVSDHETFGMVYIEAMLAGCITIASKGGGVDGVIVNGENGFLSEQGNAEELQAMIIDVESLEDLRKNTIREKSIYTALEFRDSVVADKYLMDVCSR